MEKILLPRTLVNRILTQAQQDNAHEVCGLIGAINGAPVRTYPVTNVAKDIVHRYEMDPKQQIDAMRHMRDNGEELFAIYHSHPDAPAQPSRIDLAQAAYPGVFYLIVSLNTQGVLEMRGFRLQADTANEVVLELE